MRAVSVCERWTRDDVPAGVFVGSDRTGSYVPGAWRQGEGGCVTLMSYVMSAEWAQRRAARTISFSRLILCLTRGARPPEKDIRPVRRFAGGTLSHSLLAVAAMATAYKGIMTTQLTTEAAAGEVVADRRPSHQASITPRTPTYSHLDARTPRYLPSSRPPP